jgi:hypothetical protein
MLQPELLEMAAAMNITTTNHNNKARLYASYFTFASNSVPMSLMSSGAAKRPRVIPTLETKLKFTAHFETGK